MASEIKVNGLTEMRARIKRLRQTMPQQVGAALYVETQIEATEVKRRTPVDTGALRGTITVYGPTFERNTIFTVIAAGGPAAPYALFVHENLDAIHKVGQAKFIESVILESRPYILQRVLRRIDLRRAL